MSPAASDAALGEHLAIAVRALRSGGVVAYPTETFYGLAVDPRNSAAVDKVFFIKGRPDNMALPLIAASVEQVREQVGTMTPLAERLARRGWPGALTLIIPASPALCAVVHRSTGTVAVRVADNVIACGLARAAGHPITSTSANLSGAAACATAQQVVESFGDGIDVVIDAGPTPGGLASTIVDATGDTPLLVRAGAIAWDRVLEFLH